MPDGGETLTPNRPIVDIIAELENGERLREEVIGRAGLVLEETDAIIDGANERASAAQAEIDTVEEAIRQRYQELQQSVRGDSGVAPEFAAGIIYGVDLREARIVEQQLDEFNQLITVPNTPVLIIVPGRFQIGMTVGEPMELQIGRYESDTSVAVPVSSNIFVYRAAVNSNFRTEGFCVATSEHPLNLNIDDILHPLTGELNQGISTLLLDRDFDGLLAGHEAVNQFLALLKTRQEESREITSVTRSSIFGIWVASRLANLGAAGIELNIDDGIIEGWRDQIMYHAAHYLSAVVDRPKVEVLLDPELTKLALSAFETSSAEAVDILRAAFTESASKNETNKEAERRLALLKVYMQHDLGLSLPEGWLYTSV